MVRNGETVPPHSCLPSILPHRWWWWWWLLKSAGSAQSARMCCPKKGSILLALKALRRQIATKMSEQRGCRNYAVICILKMWGHSKQAYNLPSLYFSQFRETVVRDTVALEWVKIKVLECCIAIQCNTIYNAIATDKECNKENQDCISKCALLTLLTTSKSSDQ